MQPINGEIILKHQLKEASYLKENYPEWIIKMMKTRNDLIEKATSEITSQLTQGVQETTIDTLDESINQFYKKSGISDVVACIGQIWLTLNEYSTADEKEKIVEALKYFQEDKVLGEGIKKLIAKISKS